MEQQQQQQRSRIKKRRTRSGSSITTEEKEEEEEEEQQQVEATHHQMKITSNWQLNNTKKMKQQQQEEVTPTLLQVNYGSTTSSFCVNDHVDIVVEILTRLDGQSLAKASCVCRLWSSISKNDSLWESLCFRNVSPPQNHPAGVRSLVTALGGYRSLYMLCVRPLGNLLLRQQQQQQQRRRRRPRHRSCELTRRAAAWSRHGAQLFLSLFCVDYYERQFQNGGICTGVSSSSSSSTSSSSSSLMFLCKPVNV